MVWSEEIANLFIIYLQIRGTDHESSGGIRFEFYVVENGMQRTWDDSQLVGVWVEGESVHGECFTGSCLSISDDGGIVSLKW